MVFDRLRQKVKPQMAQKSAPAASLQAGVKAGIRASAQAMAAGGFAGTAQAGSASVSRVQRGFLNNPVCHRAVKLVSEAASSLPILLQNDQERFETHPILSLLARPNLQQGRADLLEAVVSHLMLSGNAYIEAAGLEGRGPKGGGPESGGLPCGLHVLRPERVQVRPGRDGWPEAYSYQIGREKRQIPVDPLCPQLLHIRAFHPLDDHYGFAPLEAAGTAVDVHTAAARWSRALLDNAAQPSGALVWNSEGGVMDDAQFRRLSEEISANYQGAKNAGRPMVLEGGLDWKPMGLSPSDMEFHRTKDAAARDIALAFGVPPMLLGIPGDATYANYQEANRAFYRLTVLPLAARVLGALSSWLSGLSGESAELRVDLDQVQALATEREAQWRRISGADFLTAAEKRHLLGLPNADPQTPLAAQRKEHP